MAVWKSSPNGKSEPVSRQNNSLLGNLNGSELTFVSCQVESKRGVGRVPSRGALQSVPVSNPTAIVGPYFFFYVTKECIFLPAQHMPTLALSFVMGAALWIRFKSAPTHSDLGRIGGAGKSERCCHGQPECWPCHGLTPFLFFVSLGFSQWFFSLRMFLWELLYLHDVMLYLLSLSSLRHGS